MDGGILKNLTWEGDTIFLSFYLGGEVLGFFHFIFDDLPHDYLI